MNSAVVEEIENIASSEMNTMHSHISDKNVMIILDSYIWCPVLITSQSTQERILENIVGGLSIIVEK